MNEFFDITIIRLIAAYIFILILLLIAKYQDINNKTEIIVANLRMTVQLVLVGYVLTYIFNNPNPLYTLLILTLMELFAIHNIYNRVDAQLSFELKKIIALAMISGTVMTIIYFMLIVIDLSPWYQPQYFIPISGMLIGNSMTGISLGATGLINGINDNKKMIENALMLGAKPQATVKVITNRAFYNAILPTINSMMGMGIIFLPGMMTGQILAGAAPLTAIKYQIAIMLGILGSVTLTVYILVNWGVKTFFNDRSQINID
jgi:putative ABC transport system permease protein